MFEPPSISWERLQRYLLTRYLEDFGCLGYFRIHYPLYIYISWITWSYGAPMNGVMGPYLYHLISIRGPPCSYQPVTTNLKERWFPKLMGPFQTQKSGEKMVVTPDAADSKGIPPRTAPQKHPGFRIFAVICTDFPQLNLNLGCFLGLNTWLVLVSLLLIS